MIFLSIYIIKEEIHIFCLNAYTRQLATMKRVCVLLQSYNISQKMKNLHTLHKYIFKDKTIQVESPACPPPLLRHVCGEFIKSSPIIHIHP